MVMILYLVCYDTLLQNATDIITKCDSYFITKCGKSLLLHVSELFLRNMTVLLQNVTVITKCDAYYKIVQILIFLKFQFAVKSVKLVTNFRFSYKHLINQ